MSTTKKERNKDISNFLHLCKDLFKYIKRRIIKRYVYPEMTSIPSKLNNLSEEDNWKYFNTIEEITIEDKIYDIFKDNTFLVQVQKCYESLEIVIASLEDNKKNFEYLKKNIEVGEKKIQLLSELNSQLNQYFNSNSDTMLKKDKSAYDSNSINKSNIISHLSLVKSFNILNDLKIINSINDLNTQENNNNLNSCSNSVNNNVILDNKIIANNIQEKKLNDNIAIIINDDDDENKNEKRKDSKILSKKKKREKSNEKYIELSENNNSGLKSFSLAFPSNNNNLNKNNVNKKVAKISNSKDIVHVNMQIKGEEINKNEKKIINNLIDKIKISPQLTNEENNFNDLAVENNIKINNNLNYPKEQNNKEKKLNNRNKDQNLNSQNNNLKYRDNGEVEFERILKNEFSSIYSDPNNIQSNKDIIQEIKNILKSISQIKFPQSQNKFEDPSIIGTHKNFDTMYLLDSLPAIDILFKCKDIKSIDEINSISEETMVKKLCLSYIEICKGYDKESEIVKVTNKCKIKINDNYFFIYINLFFANVNISSYNKKEQCINRYKFSNEIYNHKDKILICLFFRRWRRKYKLFFIIPEFLDIIINFYFNEKDSISLIIENIFYDLFNGEINFYGKKNANIDDEKNINEIIEFIGEWYNNQEHRTALNSAIIATNECLLKNDFYSVVKSD